MRQEIRKGNQETPFHMRVTAEAFPPSKYIREELAARKWTQKKLAWAMGITRAHLTDLLAGLSPVTPYIANRLAVAFGSEAQTWLNLQTAYDRAKKGN